ncbi:GNAT family N-acetyltransferase [Rahnella sp. CG8]|uniref:GNAT family N-acetyltransferase n=1 Tax=Rahnella sp. CG8 TaxID=2726078 RepID=UPI0020343C0C|nr:GNAT family N-acetyltransferase [Rahnella sp. CG8]MCM2448476.1 GNAT family N-acetyltransferase [Rahnella sp. CG8]
MTAPILSTDRLILRPLVLEDAQAIQQLAGDPRVAIWTTSFTTPFSHQQSVNWVNRAINAMQAGQAISLAITLSESAKLIGVVNLRLPENERPQLGYWLGVAYWGKGYCTEAVQALLRYGFRQLGLEQIHARCYDNNVASEKVMLRCGMRKEPTAPITEEIKGLPVRLVNYSINRCDGPM